MVDSKAWPCEDMPELGAHRNIVTIWNKVRVVRWMREFRTKGPPPPKPVRRLSSKSKISSVEFRSDTTSDAEGEQEKKKKKPKTRRIRGSGLRRRLQDQKSMIAEARKVFGPAAWQTIGLQCHYDYSNASQELQV